MLTTDFNFGTKQSFESLIHRIKVYKCILCAGSGLSKQYHNDFPSWKEFAINLLNEIYRGGRVDEKTHENLVNLINIDKKYLEVLEACRRRMEPEKFQIFLKNQFESPLYSKITQEEAHLHLINIPFFGLVTTNYDQLIESAYLKRKIEIPVYTQNDAPSLGTLLQIQQPHTENKGEKEKPAFLFKVHGDLIVSESCIITLDDYRNLILRNPAYRLLMRTLLSQYSFLFVGFSLTDSDFQLLLQDVFDAYEGEIPDHYALIKDIGIIEQEVFYRTYRIRIIPYTDHKEVPVLLQEINNHVSNDEVEKLPDKPTLDEVRLFVNANSNFEDPIHRKQTIVKYVATIVEVFLESINNPNIGIEELKMLLEIERVLTHHFYLFPDLSKRIELAPKLIDKALQLSNARGIRCFEGLKEHKWKLYMVAIEDIGFPAVRSVERTEYHKKSKKDINLKRQVINTKIKIMEEVFHLFPREDSEGDELRAACYLARVRGLQLINLEDSRSEGFGVLERAVALAQKANWESLESAILQDIVRPEPNPFGDENFIVELRTNHKKLSNSQIRLRESIELARYKGMHRRVIGGLIGMSLLANGEEKIKYIRHARDYYSLHLVDQPPLFNTIFAEEVLALADFGQLTKFEKEKRFAWLNEDYGENKKRYSSLHYLYQRKLEDILNVKFLAK